MFTRIVLDNFLSFGHIDFEISGAYGKPLNYAFVYGENGSGKTNLVRSIQFLREITDTITLNDAIGHFANDNDPSDSESLNSISETMRRTTDGFSGASTLEEICKEYAMAQADSQMHVRYEFLLEGKKGWYDLTFTMGGEICREELVYATPKGNLGRYFLVEKTEGFPNVGFGRGVFRGDLSRNLRMGIDRLWGKNTALAIVNSQYARNSSAYMERWSSDGVSTVLGFILSTSTNIAPDGMAVNSPLPYLRDLEHGWIGADRTSVLDAYEAAISTFFIRLCSDIVDIRYDRRLNGSGIEYRLMVTKIIAGKERLISFEKESSGIKKLLNLFPSLMSCTLGSVSFIDELDSGIHDRMVCDLIAQTMPAIKGQLIVTTHNTSLLETLDPRHVFVIRVDADGYKDISSFNDIAKTRESNNNRIRYGNGLFGGIPLIRDLDLDGIAEVLSEEGDAR